MKYWLMKSEPLCFSFDDLKDCRNSTDCWDGVRNYQARNMMRDDMSVGDLVFFYHSNCNVPGIVGVAKVVKKAYPDHTAFDPDEKHFDPKSDPNNPRWLMVDVQYQHPLPRKVSLDEMRDIPSLQEMMVLRKGNRLSITPVTEEEWQTIVHLANQPIASEIE